MSIVAQARRSDPCSGRRPDRVQVVIWTAQAIAAVAGAIAAISGLL